MDPGRYGLQQGWEHNSALEGYGAVHDSSFRAGVSYDDRRFVDERFSRDNVYPRGSLHRDMLERDSYPPPHSTANMWPQTRRRSYEEEYSIEKDYRRHEKLPARYGARDRDDYAYDDYDYDYRSRASHHGREDSHERNYDYGRQSYDSDYDKDDRREGNWRRRESRDRERDKRGPSWERDGSPYGRHEHSRSRSHGRDDRARSRSPLGRNHGRSHREDSYDDSWHGRDRHRNHNDRYHHDQYSVAPSATVVAKGLSPKTTEEDLYQILAEWGPLRHVRVIKERNSGISRGFAFIDFPSVDAAQAMMDRLGDDGLLVDGRKLFFEYSSKPTGMAGGSIGVDTAPRSGHGNRKSVSVPSDWMCTICGCINFARRTFCFQCNEPRTEDAPPADMTSSNPAPIGKKGEAGPTYVLVVRGLDENADEEMLRYEFSKHAPIKDLRLVRDKFTHVSRGFAFVHFYSVEDATKALDATNGTTLEKNGQILRVAYAKSIIGPGSTASGASQSSSLAAAAIEAATFAQQYDAVGWAPKEYNPDDKQSSGGQEQGGVSGQNNSAPPQSGFVWDEASGYYFDAASGFYYDGNTGLYYDGNNSAWYSFDHTTQQYVPCTNQSDETTEKQIETSKASDGSSSSRKVVISAPAATITANEKSASLPDAVQAAAAAAIAAEKKEKEKLKEIRLASKSSILANKKKMNNVLSIWKQRSHEGQAPRVALDDNQLSISAEEKAIPASSTKNKLKNEVLTAKENAMASSGFTMSAMTQSTNLESQEKARSVTTSSAGTLKGVIRGSGLRVVKSDTLYTSSAEVPSTSSISTFSAVSSSTVADMSATVAPFRTDASALGSYAQPVASGSKRRFSEMPSSSVLNKEQSQSTYRDRAAERRNLYSSSAFGDDISTGVGDSNRDSTYKRGVGVMASMPFPPGVGGGRVTGDLDSQSYDIITADRAIDESNVGNRMLRNMGWHEGLGLGKDGSGMVEPVQAQTMETRAGLGSQPKKVDPNLEVQAGDSYKAVIQKKAIARFREMS